MLSAISNGVPVIAYDRLIEDPTALYITFDNKLVGKLEAEALLKVKDSGNYVVIKGNKADYPLVYFFARCEDRNEPGSNGQRDGALKGLRVLGKEEELGREPTDEELGGELGLTAARVSRFTASADSTR